MSRAATDGIAGVVLDHDHLKALHLLLPIRNIMSYMYGYGLQVFPICFLFLTCCGKTCKYKRHTPKDLQAAMERKVAGTRDQHIWITIDQIVEICGLKKLMDSMEPSIVHCFLERKLNNLHAILDITSATKHCILCHSKPSLTDAVFFVMYTTIFINEGHYLLAFLWTYPKVAKGVYHPNDEKLKQKELKQFLVANTKMLCSAGMLPKLIDCENYDPLVFYNTLVILEQLYGKQPFSGYNQGSGRQADDDTSIVAEGEGGRLHRVSVRLTKIVKILFDVKGMINLSPIYAFDLVGLLLNTHFQWRPYQAQLVLKRYFPIHYGIHWAAMKSSQVPLIELAGPGTLLFLRKLCPQGFGLVGTLESGAEDTLQEDDTSGTVEGYARAGIKHFARRLLQILVLHQDRMLLHKQVNRLLGIVDLDYDAMQHTICEARCFIYASRPRKSATGFALSMRDAHKAWCLLDASESHKIAI